MITGPSLHFEAKLIDVETAEVVTAVDISQSTAHELSAKLVPIIVKGGAIAENQAVAHATEVDTPDLRDNAAAEMMGKLAGIIASGKPHEARPSAKEMALDTAKKKCEEDLATSQAERQRLVDNEAKRARADEEDKRRQQEAEAAAAAAEAAKKAPLAMKRK